MQCGIIPACKEREFEKMVEPAVDRLESLTNTTAINAIYSEQELNKDSQVSVRMERGLYQALETQTEIWNFKNVSQTVRAILTFYFLPVMYEYQWKSKKVSDFKNFMEEKQRDGYSLEQAKANYFLFQAVEYLEFLEQAKVMSSHSLRFMERATEKMNSILQETESKIEQAIKEIEQEQEK